MALGAASSFSDAMSSGFSSSSSDVFTAIDASAFSVVVILAPGCDIYWASCTSAASVFRWDDSFDVLAFWNVGPDDA